MTSLPFLLLVLSLTQPHVFAASSDTQVLVGTNVTGWRTGNCDTSAADNCDQRSSCQNGLLGVTEYYRCVCEQGGTGDGYADSTGCIFQSQPCTNNSHCHINGMCNLGKCVCRANFFGDGYHVCSVTNLPTIFLDINNITDWRNGTCSSRFVFCDTLANCEQGRVGDDYYFRCVCPKGFLGDGYKNGTGCPLNRTKCETNKDCHQYGFCNTTDFYCQCKPGFYGDGAESCTDIDECATFPCDKNAKCDNIPGSFVCTCNFEKHYEGNGFVCKHRCDTNFHCHPDAHCNTTVRTCMCKHGFAGDGINCTDVNECAGPNICQKESTCINEPGSYQCKCNNGYTNVVNKPGYCTALPMDCEDIRVNFTRRGNGMYEIDPDFTGPADNFTVYCKFLTDYAVTIAQPSKEEVDKVDAKGDLLFNYSTNPYTLQALLSRSYFCYQSTLLSCESNFRYNTDFMWKDAFNQTHTSWAGSSEDGMCGCGQLRKCHHCHCNNRKGRDFGYFVNKTQLPVMSVHFGSGPGGKLTLGGLQCGPRVFDIPPDCEYWRTSSRYNPNGAYHIDLDGPFGNHPVLVYCDLRTYAHVAITEMQVQQENISLATLQTVPVNYLQGTTDVLLLVANSQFCIQRVEYFCRNSGITGGRVYVNVSSNSRQLPYFPGASGVADSCGCGATQSCQNTSFRCNCDILDGVQRRDLGDIINRADLPVRAVTGGTTANENFFLVSHLQCGRYQFGIPPNCERLRANSKGKAYPYSYLIDPDSVPIAGNILGNVPPFLAECRFNENPGYGITVIHHFNESWFEVGADFFLTYLQVTLLQLAALKRRSTYCIQNIDINCHSFSLTYSGEVSTWTGLDQKDYVIKETLTSCKLGAGCQCDGSNANRTDKGMLTELAALPVMSMNFSQIISQLTSVTGSSASIKLGPLECTELFPTCAALYKFVDSIKHLGEKLPETEATVTIDPDGPGNVTAFEVSCKWPDDTVIYVTYPPSNGDGLSGNDPNGKSKCFDVVYKEPDGDIISPQQMLALRDKSANCFQRLEVWCQYAKVSGMVNFTTCDGKDQIGWAGSVGQDSCQCGVTRHCAGGRNSKCHCDMADGKYRKDGAVIIRKDRLPVCRVCMSLDGIPLNMSKVIPRRMLRFSVSALNCHAGGGRHVQTSCQIARMRRIVNKPTTEIVYMNIDNPIPVACKHWPDPPTGTLEMFPEQQVFRNVSGNLTIILNYYTANMTILHELMLKSVYCAQRIYFFCVPDDTPEFNLTGINGWRDIDGNWRQTWNRLQPEEIDRNVVCQDFSELCDKCGDIPRGYVIYTKAFLPVTSLQLTVPDKVTIVVDSANCFDLYQHCYEIMRDGGWQWWSRSGHHAIDPDGPGGVTALKVKCSYKNNAGCAITTVASEPANRNGRSRTGAGGMSTQTVTYFQNSAKQIQALTNVSSFCWQPVGFDCTRSPLINKNDSLASHYTLQHTTSYSFGTGQDTDFLGCACGVTGSCGGNNDTCRCDINAATPMRDEGIVSDKERLPVTDFMFASQGPGSSSKMSAGDIKCSNSICKQFPKDCHEALTKYKDFEANGINYRKSGEFLIHPKPHRCSDPFLVYCEMDLVNNIGITKIITKATQDIIMRPGDTENVEYYGLTKEQIRCLVDQSTHCIQPVAYQCYEAKLLGGGVYWKGSTNVHQIIWGGGIPSTCACAVGQLCGGDDSRTQQLQRKCNCDIMDSVWRKDAGVFTNKAQLPLTVLDLRSLIFTNDSRVNVTIGDLRCGQNPIGFNECATVYHDCSEHADCIDKTNGYACKCHKGWEGLTQNRTFNNDLPAANGRECPDNNECSFNVCPIGISECVNTPGSFKCYCHKGFEKTGPTTCKDVNECTTNTHDCDVNARCTNQYGTFKCTCHKNFRGNGTRGNCNQIGNCVLFGDPHTVTFDNRWTDYQGVPECPLVAVTDVCPGPNSPAPGAGKFKVIFIPWRKSPQKHGMGQFTWVRSLEVHVQGHVIKMLQGRKLIVDDIEKLAYTESGLTVFDNGQLLILKTGDGKEIQWDGDEVAEIYMPTTFKDRLCGMCGNYNGNPKDDWIVGPGCNGTAPGSNGTVITTDNEAVFGNSWTVATGSAQCVPSCEPVPPGKTCIISQAQAEILCAKVHDRQVSLFKECLKQLDHTQLMNMQRSCVFDICHVESDTDAVVCKYAEQVAALCQQDTQVDVSNWRTADFCSKACEDNRVYRVCDGDLSQQKQTYTSCLQYRAPDAGFTVTTGCVAGCYCPKGYLEEGSKCVKEENCGCFFNGTYVKKGQVLTTENCGESVVCGNGGVVKNVSLVCGAHQNCTLKDNVVGCHCVDGYILVRDQCKPDPCAYLKCKKGAECVEGQCQCKKGYLGDCEKCYDLNECTTDQDNCVEEFHEKCVNTEGSYYCTCEPGYYRSKGRRCVDVDECKLGEDRCPANSQCLNRDGDYACACCIGYTFSKGKCVWEDESTEFFNASAPNITCCDCNTPACNKSGSVCGSDGVTYPSVRALVVQSCLQGKKVHAMYEGRCQPNCSQVVCLQPFAKCEEPSNGKPATCGCPSCTNIDIKIINMVCASDTKIYRTKCEFEAAMCINNIVDVIIVNDPATCLGPGGPGGPGNSTNWSPCSTPCGFGVSHRNVTTSSGNYTIKAVCYKSCENQTCANINCTADRHCIETPTGPQCSCPICGGEETSQVCGSVGRDDPVTYRNFCELKKEACLRREKYYKLEDNACPREPLDCNAMNFYEWRKDKDGCVNTQPELYPVCKGGCGTLPDKCCYKKTTGSPRLVKFKCPNGVVRMEEVTPITSCHCIPLSELNAILAAQQNG